MPTNKSDSEYEYRECLDVGHDTIQRNEAPYTFVLCGDLNGSLLWSRNNKHDIILKDFVKNHCLSSGIFVSNQSTCYHFNGAVTAQIDYVLSSDPQHFTTYDILNSESLNVSTHVPVKTTLRVCLQSENISPEPLKPKSSQKKVLSWGKIDQEKYSEELNNSLPSHTSICDVESNV